MKRVIKIGGRAQSDVQLAGRISSAWRDQPRSFCIVHGGGDRISEFQRRLGLEPSFVNGRRVTSNADVEIVRMVLSGLVNKELVSQLVNAGVAAVGISGEDAGLITATQVASGQLGRVGQPALVNNDVLETLLHSGYLPIISPLGREIESGDALNVNGDDAAAAIATAAGAAELLLVADVDGVLDKSGHVIPSLDQSQAEDLANLGVINKGMRAKLEAGFAALADGVESVRIAALEGVQNHSIGTRLTLAKSFIT